DLHVHERERDWNARAPIEHLVEAAVAGILVMAVVAGEAELAEEVRVQRHDARIPHRIDARREVLERDRRVRHAAARLLAQASSRSRYGPESRFGYSTRAIINAATARSGSGLSAACVKL